MDVVKRESRTYFSQRGYWQVRATRIPTIGVGMRGAELSRYGASAFISNERVANSGSDDGSEGLSLSTFVRNSSSRTASEPLLAGAVATHYRNGQPKKRD